MRGQRATMLVALKTEQGDYESKNVANLKKLEKARKLNLPWSLQKEKRPWHH